MILGEDDKRPIVEYPCEWGYKVIGNDIDKMLVAIEVAAGPLPYEVTPSNISSNDKYLSLNVSVEVASQVERDLIYEKLKTAEDILMVL